MLSDQYKLLRLIYNTSELLSHSLSVSTSTFNMLSMDEHVQSVSVISCFLNLAYGTFYIWFVLFLRYSKFLWNTGIETIQWLPAVNVDKWTDIMENQIMKSYIVRLELVLICANDMSKD